MFGWESAPNAAKIPQVKPGGLFKIQPRLVRRAKNQVQRPGVVFQKPVSLNITNGFKASRKHRNFEEFKKKFEKENGDLVFYAVSVRDYETLALNMAEIKRYIQQQQELIVYYEKAIEPKEKKEPPKE